jgi:hypothetical protein
MDWNLKKMWPAAAASLVAVTSLLSAADDMQMRNLENRVNALEQRRGANGIINPSARPGVRDGSDVFITGSALFWKPNADGLEYTIDNTKGSSLTFADDGKIKRSTGKWSWGWEAGIGYNMNHDAWDLYLNWTHFIGRSRHHDDDCECNACCTPTCSDVNFPIDINWQTPEVPVCLYNCDSDARWKMHLDMVDLELGRDFFVSKYLSLRPFTGLRWIRMKNKQDIDYQGFLSASPQITENPGVITNSVATEADVDLSTNFWGIGPRAGFNTLWSFGRGWGLFGNAAISLLYGKIRSNYEMELELANGTELNRGEIKDRSHHVTRAVTDLALGIEWDYQFKDDQFHIGFALGWEHHMFFGLNQFIRFHDNQEQGSMTMYRGDVATQGFTLTGRFDF